MAKQVTDRTVNGHKVQVTVCEEGHGYVTYQGMEIYCFDEYDEDLMLDAVGQNLSEMEEMAQEVMKDM